MTTIVVMANYMRLVLYTSRRVEYSYYVLQEVE